jgi:predicted transcriptional regulator
MEKTTVYLDPHDYRRLKQLARKAGRKPAELIREAVAEYTVRHQGGRALPGSVGALSSGRGDLSTRDEAYLEGLGEDR